MRGPANIASDLSVLDRARRLPPDNAYRREAKRLAKEGDLLGALDFMLLADDITQDHIDAHLRWLERQLEDIL